jgi:DNA invertase Pin-like site-specific DNA recombinase
MRAAIYARVSTSNHGQDPHVQVRELRELCLRRGWEIADEYVDIGISGTKETRPQLDRLMLASIRRSRLQRPTADHGTVRSVCALVRQNPTQNCGRKYFFLQRQIEVVSIRHKQVFLDGG